MFTFVIDIHGGLANFKNTRPFFYPLRQELQLVPLAKNDYKAIPEAAKKTGAFLERNRLAAWQAVFLVDLEHADDNHPFIGSLSYYMYEIKENFLRPLKELSLEPRHVFIIAVDPLNRGPKGKPYDPKLAVRWQLDTKGVRDGSGEDDIHTFSSAQVKQLDHLWKDLPTIENETFGRGISFLSAELREFLEQRHAKLTEGIAQMLENKKKVLQENRFMDPAMDRFLVNSWKNIQSHFRERITQLLLNPDSAATLLNFLPSAVLKEVIRGNIGIHSDYIDRQFRLIRFPFSDGHTRFQERMLELTFLLIAICEEAPGDKFNRNHNYQVEFEGHNIQQFSRLLQDYHQCLGTYLSDLEQDIDGPSPISLETRGYNSEKCSEKIFEGNFRRISFDFYLDYDSVTRWGEWKQSVSDTVKAKRQEFHYKTNRCIENNRIVETAQNREEIKDISHTAARLEQEYLDRFKRLPPENTLPEKDKEFDTFLQRKNMEIIDILNRRPTRNQFLIISAASFLVLYLSMVFFLRKPWDFIAWGIISILATIGAGVARRINFNRTVNPKIRKIIDEASGRINRIRDTFESHKRYLLDLFNVNIARENHRRAQQAMAGEMERKRLLRFHTRELREHLIKAESYCRLFPLNDHEYDGLRRKDFHNLDLDRPPGDNNIYSPASFRLDPVKHKYELEIDGGLNTVFSKFVCGLDKIDFKKDNVYPGE